MSAPPSVRALRARWAVARLRRVAAAAPADGAASPAAVHAMGLVFPGPLGLAAGFDRRGRLLEGAHRLGFGAVELGTLSAATPAAAAPWRPPGMQVRCGVSIGMPAGLDWSHAHEAYLRAFHAFHAGADYLTLNPGRGCPSAAHFAELTAAVARARDRLARRPPPLVVKLPAAWLAGGGRAAVAAAFVARGADGLLLSAEGAREDAPACLAELAAALGPRVCLISVGGIDSAAEAAVRLRAGAQLVQLHRALLTHAPQPLAALRHGLACRRRSRA